MMPDPEKDRKVRFQLDLTEAQAGRFDDLVDQCELCTRKELFNSAMTLFNWAVKESAKGRKVASYGEGSDMETVILPALENVSPSAPRREGGEG